MRSTAQFKFVISALTQQDVEINGSLMLEGQTRHYRGWQGAEATCQVTRMGDWIVGGRLDRIRLIVNLLSLLIPSGSDKFVRVSMRCSAENTINNAVEFLFRFVGVLECVSAVFRYLGLDLEIGLNGGSAADAPQQGRQPKHQLALDGWSGIVIRHDGCFERLVIFNIFERDNDGFRRQSMSDCVLPRPPFAIFGFRPGAAQRIAPIGLDLSKRSHPRASVSGCSKTGPPASAPASSPAPTRSGVTAMSAVCAACACMMPCAIGASSPSPRVCCQSLSATGSGSMLSF